MQFARVTLGLALLLLVLSSATAFAESGVVPLGTPYYGTEAKCIGSTGECSSGSCPGGGIPLMGSSLCLCIAETGTCDQAADCKAASDCYVYQGPTCTGEGQSTCADGFTCLYGACVHSLASDEYYGGTTPPAGEADSGTMMVDPDAGGGTTATDGGGRDIDASTRGTDSPDGSVIATGSGGPRGSSGENGESSVERGDGGTDSAGEDDSSCSAAGRPSANTFLPLLLALAWLGLRRTRA